MGDYWSLQFEARLRPEFVPMIQMLREKKIEKDPWRIVASVYHYPEIVEYSAMERASFIPFGALEYERAYSPQGSSWREPFHTGLVGDRWRVCCSVKAYPPIAYFCEKVLGLIALSVQEYALVFEGDFRPPVPVQFTSPMVSLGLDIDRSMKGK